MNTIQATQIVDEFLTDHNFKKNGYDYYKSFAVTDFENEWSEEVYVSRTNSGYVVSYPDNERKNKIYKTNAGLFRYIRQTHS